MKHIKSSSQRRAMSLEYLIGVSFFEEEKVDLSSVVIIAVPSNCCIRGRILRVSACRMAKYSTIETCYAT